MKKHVMFLVERKFVVKLVEGHLVVDRHIQQHEVGIQVHYVLLVRIQAMLELKFVAEQYGNVDQKLVIYHLELPSFKVQVELMAHEAIGEQHNIQQLT